MKDEKFQKIYNQIEEIPTVPGIYKFFDKNGEILYVGKALNLRSRVGSYFSSDHYDRPHIIPMIDLINKIEIIQTDNEVEALVLETALIKDLLPKFNVRDKDDKSPAWIYVTTQDEIPTVKIVRSIRRKDYKKGRLFGPYPSSRATRQIFKYIRRAHPFCTCRDPKEPCLYYHLELCKNPKFGKYTKEEYIEELNGLIKFLQGHRKREISSLKKQMDEFSNNQQYEEAAKLRDRIEDLQHLGERRMHYDDEEDFRKKREKLILLDLESLSEELRLGRTISRIECYDISNIQGKYSYGSMTVLDDLKIRNDQYRIFKIKGSDTPDDYRMLHEVITRRLKHINLGGDKSLAKVPDVILIDGGKGQLSKLKDLVPKNITLMGISKGRSMKKKGMRSKDQFWLRSDKSIEEIKVSKPKYLIRLRDEAHRFSLSHHRKARMNIKYESIFDQVEGIGPKRKKELIKKFGSVKDMRNVSIEDLNSVLRNRTVSNRLYQALNNKS